MFRVEDELAGSSTIFSQYRNSIYVPKQTSPAPLASFHLLTAVKNSHCFLQMRPTHPHPLPLRNEQSVKVKHRRNSTVSNVFLQSNKINLGKAVMKGTAGLPFIAIIVRPAIWMYKSKKERTRDYSLLGCNTVRSCRWITTFQTDKAPLSSGWNLKIERAQFFETFIHLQYFLDVSHPIMCHKIPIN